MDCFAALAMTFIEFRIRLRPLDVERPRRCRRCRPKRGGARDCPRPRLVAQMLPSNLQKPPTRPRGRRHVDFTAGAGRRRTVRGTGLAMAAADARREPPRPSVSDLGAVRCTGADL